MSANNTCVFNFLKKFKLCLYLLGFYEKKKNIFPLIFLKLLNEDAIEKAMQCSCIIEKNIVTHISVFFFNDIYHKKK